MILREWIKKRIYDKKKQIEKAKRIEDFYDLRYSEIRKQVFDGVLTYIDIIDGKEI